MFIKAYWYYGILVSYLITFKALLLSEANLILGLISYHMPMREDFHDIWCEDFICILFDDDNLSFNMKSKFALKKRINVKIFVYCH